MIKQFKLIFGLLAFVACTAKVTSQAPAITPDLFPPKDERPLRESVDPINGTLDSKPWKPGNAIARLNSNGEYSIIIAEENALLTCNNFFPLAPQIAFVVPGTKGIYSYDGSASGRIVNVIYPYTKTNGGGSENILAAKSQIVIDQVTDMTISGNVAALSPEGLNHNYDLSGKFKAQICDTITSNPIRILKNGLDLFQVNYSETIRTLTSTGSYKYEIRLMDKVPTTKCNTWSSWATQEYPIYYLTISVSDKPGAFNIYRGVMTYGHEYSSGGISTDAFDGKGKINKITATGIELAVESSDYAGYDIKVNGTILSSVCK